MKTILSLGLMGLMTAAIVGCEASGRVGDDDPDVRSRKTTVKSDEDSYERKTTIKTDDGGERTITREVERD